MKLTRNTARALFFNLGQVALRKMDSEVLEIVMSNIETLRKVNNEWESMTKELAKVLYGDVEKMTEDEREAYSTFMEGIVAYERAVQGNDQTKANELREAAKAINADMFKLYEKQLAVLNKLGSAEIEVDIKPVNWVKFSAGIIKSNDNWSAFGVDAIFNAMYAKEDEVENDFSELDELLKD